MLRQRVITALFLVLLAVSAIIFLPSPAFTAFISLIGLLAAWEWTALAGLQKTLSRSLAVLLAALLAVLLQPLAAAGLPWLTGMALLWWLLMFLLVSRYPLLADSWLHPWLLLPAGFCTLFPLWFTLLQLRVSENFLTHILLLLGLVAAADIAAYFSGRAWGRHKLAPAVSPNKSWEGVIGGLLASTLLGLLAWHFFLPPLSPLMLLLLALLLVLLAASSVLGDLTESMLKRGSRVKDSGSLLPGHGGVLDRIDGLTAAAPVYLLVWQVLL